jgi:hypothetical protein
MLRLVACAIALLTTASSFAGDDPLRDPHITLAAARTVPVALRQFGKDQPSVNKDHFVVYIRESTDSVEVEFVPESDPVTESCGDANCVVTMSAGGVTSHGFGITYVVDKKRNRIVKTVRAR